MYSVGPAGVVVSVGVVSGVGVMVSVWLGV
jgi:hypothetical protein